MMSGFYDNLAEQIPDAGFRFLNYGLAHSQADAYSWIESDDRADKYHLSLVRHAMRGVEINGKRVLEIGCGRGGNCSYLARYRGPKKVVGIDVCAGSVHFCTQHHSFHNVDFLVAGAGELPFPEGCFDVVLNLESSHCYNDFENFLEETSRVLKRGGLFCHADVWDLALLPVDWDRNRRVLRQAPFQTVRNEDISRQVRQAIEQEDGITARLLKMAGPRNRGLIDRINHVTEAFSLALTLGKCSYRARLLRKP